MADELSNVNGGSSTNDSIPISMQQADVSSRSETTIGTESIVVTTIQTGNVGCNTRPRGPVPSYQPPLTTGWPPYSLPFGYTPPVGGFMLPVRFGNVNGANNVQNPQHSEYSRDYHVGSTSNAVNSMAVYRQQVEESHHDLVNLLTQQMTTLLNPMMADHESRFERLARQVERIARIVDYDEGEMHNSRGNNEGMENIFQNENPILNRENPYVVPREVDLAELKKGPPYVCSLLKKLPGSEKSNDAKLKSAKKYSFDISKFDQIFDAIGVQWVRNCQEFQRCDHLYRCNPQWGHRALSRNQYASYRGRARGYPRGRGGRRSFNQGKKLQIETSKEASKGATPSVHSRIVFPSDGETYPKEIPSPANMEKGKAVAQSSGIDKHKDVDVDEEYFDEGDDDMNLGECKSNPDEDYDQEDEEAFSFIRIEDEPGIFPRPSERQISHLRPLHIVAVVNGFKTNKVLIDGGGGSN
ncbi:hypothetical protein Ahy_B08g092594 [Arachis hypogaea]|uniref:Uncharacterized protein n=1 Tax=Arachis hypogaea TaxID=3818 RepID=A0A444Y4A6_ARAHY|nr:hypothetical protein Ahy_B08g092594 [Arachis hypogaea]